MIFSSHLFLFGFLPFVLFVYFLLRRIGNRVAVKLWLVSASLFFYSWGQLSLLPVFVFTVLFAYFCAYAIGRWRHKKGAAILFLCLGIAESLGLLFYYKYFNFALESANALFGADFTLRKIALPIGISFYTFQIVSYLVDTYRGRAGRYSLLDYLTYLTFFPQLSVGPIVRHNEFIPQLGRAGTFRKNNENLMLGIYLFSIGCAKKILLADGLIRHAAAFYQNGSGEGFFESWGAVLAYTFAYYFDFSGYIDMALGLGRIFNIRLPHNFNSPYKARNMADFWRRWNITVSEFFYDYIFKGIFRFGDRAPKLILATLVTFLVSGLWHGAGVPFLLWGLANGVLVAATNLAVLRGVRLPSAVAYPLTFFFVLLTRVLFDSATVSQAARVYRSMFLIGGGFESVGGFFAAGSAYLSENAYPAALILIGAVLCFFFRNTKELSEAFTPKLRYAVYSGVLLTVSAFFMSSVSQFLYFRF